MYLYMLICYSHNLNVPAVSNVPDWSDMIFFIYHKKYVIFRTKQKNDFH